MLIPKETLKLLKRCIRRGESIKFSYISKNGKTSVHECTPIEIDIKMTLYGIENRGVEKENCWKIRFISNIVVDSKPDRFIVDQYGVIKSALIGNNRSYVAHESDMTLGKIAVVR